MDRLSLHKRRIFLAHCPFDSHTLSKIFVDQEFFLPCCIIIPFPTKLFLAALPSQKILLPLLLCSRRVKRGGQNFVLKPASQELPLGGLGTHTGSIPDLHAPLGCFQACARDMDARRRLTIVREDTVKAKAQSPRFGISNCSCDPRGVCRCDV